MIFAAIAVATPVIEVVIVIAGALNVGVELVGSGESANFPRMNSISRAATGDFALTVADDHDSGISCLVDVNFVIAGTKNRKSQVRGINFKRFVVLETAYPHVKGTFGDADDVSHSNRRRRLCKFETAAFASYVRQHTRLTKGMGHLHQMIFGDSERIRDFGDRRTSLRSCCEEDEEPQTVIGERRQSHDLQASIVQRVEVIAMTVAAVL